MLRLPLIRTGAPDYLFMYFSHFEVADVAVYRWRGRYQPGEFVEVQEKASCRLETLQNGTQMFKGNFWCWQDVRKSVSKSTMHTEHFNHCLLISPFFQVLIPPSSKPMRLDRCAKRVG